MTGNIPEEILRKLKLIGEYRKNDTIYTTVPTAHIAFERFRPDQILWKKSGGAISIPIKKPLIITDWSFSITYPPPLDTRPDLNVLKSLQATGYPIFICRHGKLVKITTALELEHAVKTIQPVHPDEVMAAVEEYNKLQTAKMQPGLDSVEIIDYVRSRELLHDVQSFKDYFPNCSFDKNAAHLKTTMDSRYLTNMSAEFFEKVLKSLQGRPPSSIDFGSSLDAIIPLRFLAMMHRFSTQIESMKVPMDFCAALLRKQPGIFKSLQSLEVIIRKDYKTPDTIKLISPYLPQLNGLILIGVKLSDLILPQQSLQLTELALAICKATLAEWIKFFNLCPEINTLTLNSVTGLEQSMAIQFPKVVKLIINECNLGAALEDMVPNVEILNIFDGVSIKKIGVLPKLRDLSAYSISNAQFVEFVNQCPQLEFFQVKDIKFLSNQLAQLKLHKKLKFLILENCEISYADLAKLTQMFPDLKDLTLTNCKLTHPEKISGEAPQHLISLQVDTLADIATLTRLYPKIHGIKAKSTADLKPVKIKTTPSLPNLADLNLEFKGELPISILSPALIKLQLTGEIELEEKVGIPILQRLTTLYMKSSPRRMIELLNRCPALTRFHLANNFLNAEILRTLNTLPNLSELTFEWCVFKDIGLEVILAKTPQLKKIVLQDVICKSNNIFKILDKVTNYSDLAIEKTGEDFIIKLEGQPSRRDSTSKLKSIKLAFDKLNTSDLESGVIGNLLRQKHPIEFVTLRLNKPISDLALTSLFSCTRNVRILVLENFNYETKRNIQQIDNNSLQELSLIACTLTIEQLRGHLLHFKALKLLYLKNCTSLKRTDIVALQKTYPHLKIDYHPIINKHREYLDAERENPDYFQDDEKSADEKDANNAVQNPDSGTYNPAKDSAGDTIHVKQFYLQDEKGFPSVSIYRKEFFNDYKLTDKIEYVPVGTDIKPIPAHQTPFKDDLQKIYEEKGYREARFSEDPGIFRTSAHFGKGDFKLTQKWQAIPGLSGEDVLLGFQSSLKPGVELGFCHKTRRYYVRLAKGYAPQVVKLAVIMQATWHYYNQPGTVPAKLKLELDEKNRLRLLEPSKLSLPDLVAFCQQKSFSSSSFQFKTKNFFASKEESIIQELIKNLCQWSVFEEPEIACRHRTTFFLLLGKALNYDNIQINLIPGLHMFPELWVNGQVQTAQLGGSSAIVHEEAVPEEKIEVQKPAYNPVQLADSIYYSKRFSLAKDEDIQDPHIYCKKILAAIDKYTTKRNVRLSFNSSDDLLSFKTLMGKIVQEQGGRYHYLAGFEYFAKTDLVPKTNDDPDKVYSDTIDFILKAKAGDVLFVDCSDYLPEHFAFDSITGLVRHIKGVNIPEGVIVFILTEKNKGKNLPDDFNSRMRFIDDLPAAVKLPPDIYNGHVIIDKALPEQKASEQTATESKTELKIEIKTAAKAGDTINTDPAIFYTEENWRQELLGTPKMMGKYLVLVEGPLLRALRLKQTAITFINAPWHLKSFRAFISEAYAQGQFNYYGVHTFPKDFTIHAKMEKRSFLGSYTIEFLNDENNDQWNYVLNQQFFDYFIETFCINNGGFEFPGGWLSEKTSEKVILVTSIFSDEIWDKLCANIEKLGIHVRFIFTHNIVPPAAMAKALKHSPPVLIPLANHREEKATDEKATPLIAKRKTNLSVYTTNDIDFKSIQLCEEYKTENIFSVGITTTYTDLFDPIIIHETIDSVNKRTRSFSTFQSYILSKLANNETVILKGRFSPAFLMSLQTLFAPKPYLFINGKPFFVTGKLVLVTDQKEVFSFTSKPARSIFTANDYWPVLSREFKSDTCAQVKSKTSGQNNLGFIQLRNQLRLHELPPLPESKEQDETERRTLVLAQLIQNNLGTMILGDTGTGKSFTIFEDLPKVYGKKFKPFVSMAKVRDWAKAPPGEDAILIVDESTLEEEDFSCLEGLWNIPPGIIIKGEFCKLGNHHRILFAGNYTHYEGRRHHRIFDYCVQTVFHPLSDETLAKKNIELLIKIIPTELLSVEMRTEVNNIFLHVYKVCRTHVAAQNTDKDLPPPLTLRNLHTMSLNFAILVKRHQADARFNVTSLAWAVAYDQVRNLFNKETKKVVKKEILQHLPNYKTYKAALAEFACDEYQKQSNFILTQKRRSPMRTLINQLAVRDLKAELGLNTSGVRGILLEGALGMGKSGLALEALKRLNFEDVTDAVYKEAGIDLPNKNTDEKEQKDALKSVTDPASSNEQKSATPSTVKPVAPRKFIRITPADPEELKIVLHIAAHKGYIVLLDKLNRFPCENILNHFLSGRDLAGDPFDQEGFMVIAEQSASTIAGAQPLSAALLNRFEQIKFREYQDNELAQFVPPQYPYSVSGYKSALWTAEVRNTIKPSPGDLCDHPEVFDAIGRQFVAAAA